jgi:cytochrome c553
MRAFVIALMIALLPLRGWVGDAMAAQMALPLVQAAAHAGASHVDCPLHGASAQMDQAQDDGTDQDGACTVCQACHTLALEASAPSSAIQDPARIVASIAAPDFASADRALSVKPPIA